jgi:hypothetical protein
MTIQNRRPFSTQLQRRPNREQTEKAWQEQEERQDAALPPGHGQIVREDTSVSSVVTVKPVGSHVDQDGNPIDPHHRITRAAPAQHLPGQESQVLEGAVAPAHQIGQPPPVQGARTVAGHADPRLAPQSQPQAVAHRVSAATTLSASGAQVVPTHHGNQSMAQRSQGGGAIHVGGQPIQPTRSGPMAASVYAVRGDVSPAQAVEMLRQGGHAP